jgi:lysophospholipase L1-like esterase
MRRRIRSALLLATLVAGCDAREPAKPASPSATAPPPEPSASAPGISSTAPSAAPARVEDGGTPGPEVVGEPRTEAYSWMSIALWNERHDALVKRAKAGKVDLLFLGDSITEGWQDNDVWQSHYGRRSAACFGIGGDAAENLIWRMENGELEGIAPRVVVVLIGTNNLGLRKDPPDAVARKITAVVATVRRRLPAARVLLLAIFPRGAEPGSEMRAGIARVNEQIARLDDGKAVRFLDLGPRLTNPNRSISKEVMPDLVHLSEKGYAIWADGMEPLLTEMMAR